MIRNVSIGPQKHQRVTSWSSDWLTKSSMQLLTTQLRFGLHCQPLFQRNKASQCPSLRFGGATTATGWRNQTHTQTAAIVTSYRSPFLHSNVIPSNQIRKKTAPLQKASELEYSPVTERKAGTCRGWVATINMIQNKNIFLLDASGWILSGLRVHSLFWTAFSASASFRV